jgi:hypothetical protein
MRVQHGEIFRRAAAAGLGLLIAAAVFPADPGFARDAYSSPWASACCRERTSGPYGKEDRKDWYERAYEYYEDGPYGYHDGDYFYDDFDFDYWESAPLEDEGDWYGERFKRYYRGGYYDEYDPYLHRKDLRPFLEEQTPGMPSLR